jgi:hypothetical protein
MPRQVKRTITEVSDAEEEVRERDEDDNPGVSLFDLATDDGKRIARVDVYRLDPKEGYLGHLEPTSTEEDIFKRWGGSEYKVIAKNAQSRILVQKTLEIAGEPVFSSDIAESRYRRMNGLPPKPKHAEPAPAAVAQGVDVKEMLMLMEERDDKRRREQQETDVRREAERERLAAQERERQAEREERVRRDTEERDERRRKEMGEAEERRLRMQRDDDERRARQHKEDLERLAAQQQAQSQQQAQMFQSMLAMLKAEQGVKANAPDPVELMLKGLALGRELSPGGGGDGTPPDPLSALIANAGPILSGLKDAAGAAMREYKGGQPATEEEDTITLRGPVAAKVKFVVGKLVERGEDPEKAIDRLARMLARPQLPQQQAGQSAAPAKKPVKRGPRKPKTPKPPRNAKPAGAPAVIVPTPMRPTAVQQ